ncbi:amino acid ABC transporter permease [Siminovitchia acidinfaciens]|uniref:Amino acid ABC transporter permease n=1 Tax=Siminovitchia acidinfaciens TaxID=2321395 RepID=A0A429Y6U8_9BACI|nr:amino acid ABC transporter permease [Siminovitchia acidinfaciens]RST77179.1 amino acid ABC transporter permease [Siminovitchia acidinfaciens]
MFSAIEFLPLLLKGTLITLQITFISLAISLVFGVFVALARISNIFILNKIASVYISIIRGTPLLVQLMYVYFVLPELGLKLTPFASAIIGLALYESAYLAEIYRGGIQSVAKGQLEAAYAIGMNYSQAMKRVILPQAFKNVLPAVGNSAILLLKNSSLTSFIAVNELMHTGELLATSTFRSLEIFTLVAAIYWILHYPMTILVKQMERKMDIDSSQRS